MKKYEAILRRAGQLEQKLIDLRRDFHRHPELGLKGLNTAKKVEGVLQALSLETKIFVNGTGVRGFLKGREPGKTIALRAGMDALPIQEETDLPCQSQNNGVMHACGHDAPRLLTSLSNMKRKLEFQ